jgi:formylglycine-generating enzyme required for sulfatase activity
LPWENPRLFSPVPELSLIQLQHDMKTLRRVSTFLFLLFFCLNALANNIAVSNVNVPANSLSGSGSTLTAAVTFTLTWDNSWRNSTNWDAAWVFMKYRKAGSLIWEHAQFAETGHTAAPGSTFLIGKVDPAAAYNASSNQAVGIFLYRDGNGYGSNNWGTTLRWNIGAQNAQGTEEVRVFAIEMVNIPLGTFSVGSGGTETNGFVNGASSGALSITSEGALTIGTGSNTNLWALNSALSSSSGSSVPASFPKGYAAFYCMKYEISQGLYRDFLNTLSYTQQAARTAVDPGSVAGTGALSSSNANRNGIDIRTPGVSSATPAVYGCNLNGNSTYNEADDGEWIACNFLSWMDGCAFLDWAGLRPMTELEYEKACRGLNSPAANEYAWGTATLIAANNITNGGTVSENTGTTTYIVAFNNQGSVQGPLRGGVFGKASPSNRRSLAGATAYGIMEMSGNLWEQVVSVGNQIAGVNTDGRSYTGQHGDGVLSANGHATSTAWPGLNSGEVTDATGSVIRGAAWSSTNTSMLCVSGRNYSTLAATNTGRDNANGIRGVRTTQ